MIKVAVVILNWNGEHFLKKFLPNVIRNSRSDECNVYVVDNASEDESVSLLKEEFSKEIEIIEFDKNYGFAMGYEKALNMIEAEYFVLLNSDVEVTPNWINPVIQLMDEDESIGACMPKLKSYENKSAFEYAGACGGFIDKFGFPFCRGRILYNIEKDTNQHNSIIDVFWASGAAMFARATAYKKAGGLDGDFFAHMEEIDLCWRMKHLGYRIVVCPDSEIYHVGGGTLPNNSPRKLYLNYRNSLYALYKNLSRKKFHRTLIIRAAIDWATALVYLARADFSFFAAVFRAHRDFFRNLSKLRKKRKALLSNMLVSEVPEIYKKGIVFSFFFKQKKIFTDLKPHHFTLN